MRFTMLVSAVALSLAAVVGSASANDKFATLTGISASPMSASELNRVVGTAAHFGILNAHWTSVDRNPPFDDDPNASPNFAVGHNPPPGPFGPGMVGIWTAEQAGGAVYVRCPDGGLTGGAIC